MPYDLTPVTLQKVRDGRDGGLEELRNDLQALSAKGRVHARHFQSHTGKGQEHLQEDHGLHRTASKFTSYVRYRHHFPFR